MSRVRRETEQRFFCPPCEYGWQVEGRSDAEGRFDPNDPDDLDCPECGNEGYPADGDLEVA